MAYIVRIVKGRYEYLYECRSRRVEEKRSPVSERIFIGRVDLETREFIPKSYVVKGMLDVERLEVTGRPLPKVPSCYLPMKGEITS